jgi:hypothetical protein
MSSSIRRFEMRYILDENHNTIREDDVIIWSKSFENSNRCVKKERKYGYLNYIISTVFLGIDHNFLGNGLPILFETMIFKDDSFDEIYCDRCSTWNEALEMHQKALDYLDEKIKTETSVRETN